MGAVKFKGMIEKGKLTDFKDNITKFNTWFEDMRTSSSRKVKGTMNTLDSYFEFPLPVIT